MTNTKQGQIQDFQGGGGGAGGEHHEFSRGILGHAPQKFLKICVSKIAIAQGGGEGREESPRLPPFESTTAKIESDCHCDVHLCWKSVDDF